MNAASAPSLASSNSPAANARAALMDCSDRSFFQGCQFGVACHAETAFVSAGGDDLDDFDFTGSQAVGGVQFADFLIERQRFGRVCQYADEVGDKAVVFQRGFDAGFAASGAVSTVCTVKRAILVSFLFAICQKMEGIVGKQIPKLKDLIIILIKPIVINGQEID